MRSLSVSPCPRFPRWFVSLLLAVLALFPLGRRAGAQTVLANLTAGSAPNAIAFDPQTNMIYVANHNSNNVTVIDGGTDAVVATVTVGSQPQAIAVDPWLNQIYVANSAGGSISVISGAGNRVLSTVPVGSTPVAVAVNPVTHEVYVVCSGSSSVYAFSGQTLGTPTPISVGSSPAALAVNPVTNKIYVANKTSPGSVSVIDGSSNSVTTTVPVGNNPNSVAVNPVTNMIYTADSAGGTSTMIDGATNTVSNTVTAGSSPVAVAVNPVTDKVYVVNSGSNNVTVYAGYTGSVAATTLVGTAPFDAVVNTITGEVYVANHGDQTVSAINGATNVLDATLTAGSTGSGPIAVAVDPITNHVFSANYNGNSVSIIDGSTYGGSTGAQQITVGVDPTAVALDPVTNKIYAATANTNSSGQNLIAVIDGPTQTTETPVNADIHPDYLAVNPVMNTVYAVNRHSGDVSLISGASGGTPAVFASNIPVGFKPQQVAINPATNMIYVCDFGDSHVSVIDGISGMQVAYVLIGPGGGTNYEPNGIAVNPVTNTIYEVNNGAQSLGIIDGATNTVTTLAIPGIGDTVAVDAATNTIYAGLTDGTVSVIDGGSPHILANISAGSDSQAVAVNPFTNTVYSADYDGNVYVINGATNTLEPTPIPVGGNPAAVSVNVATNTIYVAGTGGGGVSVIDGATNTLVASPPGAGSQSTIAVNLFNNNVYTTGNGGNGATDPVDQITPAFEPNPVPLIPTVAGVSDSQTLATGPVFRTTNVTPSFTVSVESSYTGTSAYTGISAAGNPPPTALYYKIDTLQGTWLPATISSSAGANPATFNIGPIIPQTLGTHILYTYAVYGDEGTPLSGNSGTGNSPELSNVTPFMFNVEPMATSPTLTTDATAVSGGTYSSTYGSQVSFSSTVTTVVGGNAVNAGQLNFYDGATLLGIVNLSSGNTFATSALAPGSHSITVEYLPEAAPQYRSSNSSTTITLNVSAANTSTVLTAPSTATYGSSVTLSATVSSGGSAVTAGSVTFENNGSSIGTGTVNSSGMASLTTTSLPVGNDSITAVYGATTDYNSSTSASSTIVVTGASTTTTLGGLPSSAVYGTNLTMTAAVSSGGSPVTAGTVTFQDGVTVLATSPVNSSGIASYSTSTLPVGVHNITASYGATTDYAASTSSVSQVTITGVVTPTGGGSGYTQFPATVIGATSAAQTVSVQIATAGTTISSVSVPVSQGGKQEYAITANSCSLNTPLAAGTTCNVQVTFSPAYPGLRSAPLLVVTNNGTYSFGLSGVGQGPLAVLSPGIIHISAGTIALPAGYSGDNGPATSAHLNSPYGVTVDAAGNLYISDYNNSRVRKVSPTGTITTVAGNGTAGYTGDDGPATSAEIHGPLGLAVDAAGNLYIADSVNSVIRKVNPSGIITTVAGNGTPPGFSGDGGAATSAELNQPYDVTADAAGDLYIADTYNYRVRRVDATTGVITTVAGNGTQGNTGDGGQATAAELGGPIGLAMDSAGNLYIADHVSSVVRKVTAAGIISTVAGTGTAGYNGDDVPATSAELNQPSGIVLDSAGDLYIADTFNNRIRMVGASGIITTIAGNGTANYSGDGGLATGAELNPPSGIALDNPGNLYLTDSIANVVRRVSAQNPTLNFATTTVGSTSTDSPQTETLLNIGNSALTFAVPPAGSNPNVSSNFILAAGSTCPQLSSTSSPGTLGVAQGCTLALSFTPATASGGLDGTAIVTDNSLNVSGSTQVVNLNGIANPVGTTTVLSDTTPIYGQTQIQATVAAVSGTAVPLGSVVFTVDGVAEPAVMLNNSGVAILPAPSLSVGSHTVQAVFTGNGGSSSGFNSSTATPLVFVVAQGSAAPVALTVAPASPVYGSPVTVTVTAMAGSAGIPGSTATVTAGGGNYTCITNTSGTCSVTVPSLPAGTDTITATTSATSNAGAGSGSISVLVGKANLTVTATNATRTYGTANPAFTGVVTGAVNGDTFTVSGTTTATVTSPVGTYPITPVVTGTNLADYTVTAVNGILTVTQATATQVAVGVNPSSPAYGQSAIASVTVTAGAAPVAGSTVSVAVNGQVYVCTTNASGACSVTIAGSAWNAGANTVTVTSSATANAAAGTDVVVIQVAAPITVPDFSLNLTTSSSQFVFPGQTAVIPLSLAAMNGFTGTVTLSATGLPPGATVTFNPATVTLSGTTAVTSTMSIVTAPAQAGLASGTGSPWRSGSAIRYGLLLLPLPLLGVARLRRRMRVLPRMLLLLLALAGLGAVTSGLTGCGSGYFGQPPANYAITVTGTSGSLQSSTTFTLTVR